MVPEGANIRRFESLLREVLRTMDTTDPRVIIGSGSNSPARTEVGRLPLWPRLLGIVGGVGPFAHIEFERHLLQAAKERMEKLKKSSKGPKQETTDQEFPPWIVASLPQIPDRTKALEMKGPSPVPMLLHGLDLLNRCECDFALIPCNTAHAWISELYPVRRIPILDMVQAATREAVNLFGSATRLGLLATDGTVDYDVYPSRAASISKKIQFVSPLNLAGGRSTQETVMNCIYGPKKEDGTRSGGIKSGCHLADPSLRMRMQHDLCQIIAQMAEHGAEAIILGCTELPLIIDQAVIFEQLNRNIQLIDPMEIAAKVAIRIAAGEDQICPRSSG